MYRHGAAFIVKDDNYIIEETGEIVCSVDENPWQSLSGVICPKCERPPVDGMYDACLGYLPGVKGACCGHGLREGYIRFENDIIVRGDFKSILFDP